MTPTQPVKRIEIVTDSHGMADICAIIRASGATGYTVLGDVTGWGDRGEKRGDEPSDAFRNCYILTACDEATASRIADAIRPILDRRGGLCIISEALCLTHSQQAGKNRG